MGASGLSEKLRFGKKSAWVAGGVSGMLGGLVGNQGGIRSAAMLNFSLERQAFVATATAIGVIVDGARMPIYFWADGKEILAHGDILLWGIAGVTLGTFLGYWVLQFLHEKLFRRIVSGCILALGIFMLWRALTNS
jgi:uncharacterized membrane protein YfcA